MKRYFLIIVVLCLFNFNGFSQIKFGIKGGLNYNFAGNITEVINATGGGFTDITHGAKNKAGFHLGLWSRFKFVGFAIRPELIYTELKTKYQLSSKTKLKTKKIDIPILFDKKFGPLHLFAGPSFQYILTTEFKTSDIGGVDFNKFTLGTQLGLGIQFGDVEIDARWEKGFSNNLTALLIASSTRLSLDNRPNQIIFSVSYNLL